jgi:hypothetical protein
MYVTDKFGQIGIFLAKDRLIPILEELAVSAVSLIERHCVSCEDAGHDRMERNPACLTEQVCVIAEERPRITRGTGVGKHSPHPFNETVFVNVIPEDQPTFDAAHNDVVEHSFSIKTGMSWHKFILSKE